MRGRPIALPGAWGDAARAAGSSTALAELLGVNVRTLERWGQGGCPLRRMDEVERIFLAQGWAVPSFEEI